MLVRSVQTETRRSLLYPACVAVGTSGLGRLEPDLRACRRWPESVDVAQVTENDAVRRDRALEVARGERRIRSRDDREHLIVCCMIGSPGHRCVLEVAALQDRMRIDQAANSRIKQHAHGCSFGGFDVDNCQVIDAGLRRRCRPNGILQLAEGRCELNI